MRQINPGPENERALEAQNAGYQAPASVPSADAFDAEFVDDSADGGLLDYWLLIRRRKGVIILAAILGGLAGLLFSIPQTPIYTTSLTLEIQGVNENFLGMQSLNPTKATGSYFALHDIPTQVDILKSRTLRQRVLDEFDVPEETEPTKGENRLATWRSALGLPEQSPESRIKQALGMASATVGVQTSNETRILRLNCLSTDPVIAADFVNQLAESFKENNMEARVEASQQVEDFLEDKLDDLRIKLEDSEERLQQYARASGLLYTGDQQSVGEERLRQLQGELTTAQAERYAKQSQYELLQSSGLDAVPGVEASQNLTAYQSRLTELKQELADLSAVYTDAHYKVKRAKLQIAEVESALAAERSASFDRLKNDYAAAVRREKLIEADYREQAGRVSGEASRSIQYNILRGEVDTNRKIYDTLLQRVKEAGVTSAMNANTIRILDRAIPPGRPIKPNHMVNSAMGLMAGLFGGLLFVVVRDRMDRSIKAPGDSAYYLRLPELGVIPETSVIRPSGAAGRKQIGAGLGLGKKGNSNRDSGESGQAVELATLSQTPSVQAEAFRAALTSILFTGSNGDRPRLIVVTSASPAEGKTTIVSNLALALAEINRRVLVIDADMRRPRQHKVFNVPNTWGLSDLLRERNSIEQSPTEAISRPTKIPGLFLLPSGPATHSVSNLLHSTRTVELLERVASEFDTVLIDTPPMLHMADARILGQMVDAVILVTRSGQTTRDGARTAVDRFREDGTRVLGTILNGWNPKESGYSNYGYYSDYDSYYSEQVEVDT